MSRITFLFIIVLCLFLALVHGDTSAKGASDVANADEPNSGADIRIGRDLDGPGIHIMPGEIEANILPGGVAAPAFEITNTGQSPFNYTAKINIIEQPNLDNPADLDGTRWCVMQDQQASGWLADMMVGKVKGVDIVKVMDYTMIGSPQLKLSDFDGVVVAYNNQSTNWQYALIDNRAWFEKYVNDGGALYIESGGNSGMPWNPPLPGNISGVYRSYNPGKVMLDPKDNNLVRLCGWSKGLQLTGGNWMYIYYPEQGFKDAKLPWYQIIAGANDNGDPALIAYGLGKGGVLAFGGYMGQQWVSYATGSNIGAKPAEFLTYIRSLGTPRWISISNDGGRLEPGSKRPITITLASRSMPAGDYEANVAIHYSDNPDVRDMVIDVRMTVADAPDLAASWDAAAGYPA